MVFAALALSYNLLLGSAGMLSFGHALYFGAGAYGLGIALEHFGVPLWPGIFVALIGGHGDRARDRRGGDARLRHPVRDGDARVRAGRARCSCAATPQVTGGEEGLSLNTEQVPDFLVGVVNTRNLYWFTLACS